MEMFPQARGQVLGGGHDDLVSQKLLEIIVVGAIILAEVLARDYAKEAPE
jgi:hypothetical protein